MKENKRTWTLPIFIFCVIALTFVRLVWNANFAQESMNEEAENIQMLVGVKTTQQIKNFADWAYQKTVINTHLRQILYNLYIPTKQEKDQSDGLEELGSEEGYFEFAETRFEGFFDLIYWLFIRIGHMSLWAIFWIPAMFIAGYVGYQERNIKISSYGYASPAVHNLSMRIATGVIAGLFLLFMIPFPFPPIVVPIALGLVVIAIRWSIGNVQKRI